MCQHKAPHREWEPALRHLGHDNDRKYPEPRDPVRRLRRPRQGRARPGHDDRQDDERRRTSSSTPPPQLDARAAQGVGRLLRAAQRGVPQGEPHRARTSSAGSTTATCTTTSAASRPSTRASAGCSKYLDDEGLAENTIVVYASDQGFYLGEHGWFDKRWIFEESLRTPLLVRWPGVTKPGSVNERHRLATSTSPRRSSKRPACRSRPRCRAAASCRCCKGQTPADWRKSFYYHYYEYPGAAPRPPALRRRHRPLQARPLLRARRRLLGAVRPAEGPARAAERLRRAGVRRGAEGTGDGAGPAAQGAEGARPGPRRRPRLGHPSRHRRRKRSRPGKSAGYTQFPGGALNHHFDFFALPGVTVAVYSSHEYPSSCS